MDYQQIREEIRTLIVHLEAKHTQEMIAQLLTEQTGINFYAKDINLLKVFNNKRWKGPAKKEKLNKCLQGLKLVWHSLKGSSENIIVAPGDQQKIFLLIDRAVKLELELYKSVPMVENALNELKAFMYEDGQAYKHILNTIGRVTARQWTMQDDFNPSYCELLDIVIKRRSGNRVFVETYEHWFLKWYSFIEKDYNYIYKNTNEQLYVVEKRQGSWKIVSNIYSAPDITAPPVGKIKNHYQENLESDKPSLN